MKQTITRALALSFLIASTLVGVGLFMPACGGRTPRCQEYGAVKCPAGQSPGERPDSTCEQLYEGHCGGVWADYVDCYIEDPTCIDDTTQTAVHVTACDQEAYARCECEYESKYGPSPWCSL